MYANFEVPEKSAWTCPAETWFYWSGGGLGERSRLVIHVRELTCVGGICDHALG